MHHLGMLHYHLETSANSHTHSHPSISNFHTYCPGALPQTLYWPDTPNVLILSTPPRCTHIPNSHFLPNSVPQTLFYIPHPIIHILTYILKYIYTQIHNQSCNNTPSRYTLIHYPNTPLLSPTHHPDTFTFKHTPSTQFHQQPICTTLSHTSGWGWSVSVYIIGSIYGCCEGYMWVRCVWCMWESMGLFSWCVWQVGILDDGD